MRARTPALGWAAALLLAASPATAVTVGTVPQFGPMGPQFVTATQPFSGPVGSVSDCDPAAWSATIDWGDGQTSPGVLADTTSPGSCAVTGSHTYAQVAADVVYTATVTATRSSDGTSVSGPAYVNVRPWSVDNIQPLKSKDAAVDWRLFTFTPGPALEYVAAIDWGDGTTTNLSMVDASTIQGWVRTSHTFPAPGAYTVDVSLLRDGAEQAHVTTRAVISNCGSVAAQPGPAPVVPAGSANGRWLNAAFQDLVGRGIDRASLAKWRAELKRGVTRAQVAAEIQATRAYRGAVVSGVYRTLLGRDPSAEELSHFADRVTTEEATAQVALTDEYASMLRNADIRAFFDTFVCDTLHRTTAPAETERSVQAAKRDIAANVLASAEYRRQMVSATSLRLLRVPSSQIRDRSLRRALARANSVQDAEVALVSSRAYYISVLRGA